MRSAHTFSKLLTFLEVKVILMRWMGPTSESGLESLYIDILVVLSSDRDMVASNQRPQR